MNFSEEKIKYLLYGYSHDYQELIINIFEIVLLETIACKLVNRDIQDLAISTLELNELYKLFKNKNNIEIKNTVIKTYQRVLCEIGLDSNEYKKYIEKNLDNITQMIINAVKQKTLDKLFIPQKFIEY